jgi:hypothetical protein
MKRLSLPVAVVLSIAGPSAALAQCTPGGPSNPPAARRAITGIVMDSAHNALENAEVLVKKPKRSARTDANGIFRIADLDTGTYELTVRRIGHDVAVQSYIVTDSGGVARFCLFTEIQGLAPMVTSVFRGGISGVVGDTAHALVKNAQVRVLGENKIAYSDSGGAFFFDVKPGEYSLAVKKKGYGSQVVGVRVPKDSGRKVVIWLGSPPRNPNTLAIAIEAMRMNILMTPSFRYHRVTTEELASTDLTIEQLIRVKGRTNVRDDCEAHVAGTEFSLPIYMLNKDDISMLEIMGAPLHATRSGPTSMNGMKDIPNQSRPGPTPDCPSVTAWMKP